MKNHLKRIAAPKTWLINRKKNVFAVRPNPGAHSFSLGLPLGMVIRDNLQLAGSMSEVKRLLNNNEVLIDGQRKKDHRLVVGLFDVISISSLNKFYQVVLDLKGRLALQEISEEQSASKVCKIVGKTMLKKGLTQLGLHDGKTLLAGSAEKSASVGDSIKMELPSLKVVAFLPLKSGAKVLLTAGKHSGASCVVEQIALDQAVCQTGSLKIETAKNYLFVVG
ncbi:MAG TPA: 30S ribosomal protein S4e [Candidatus Nanoarchaeia archaeon]|nr:30S ribosomal protein S4e [Candidatus Nanoarchaeia archaeon]